MYNINGFSLGNAGKQVVIVYIETAGHKEWQLLKSHGIFLMVNSLILKLSKKLLEILSNYRYVC